MNRGGVKVKSRFDWFAVRKREEALREEKGGKMFLAGGVKCYGEVMRLRPFDFMRWVFFFNGGSCSNVS